MPQPGLASQTVTRFLGVNLRQDGLTAADEAVRRAVNADLHSELGTAQLRLGREAQFSSALSDPIRRLAKFNGTRYQVAGTTAYRDESSIVTGLSATEQTTLVSARPLLDSTTWTFIADVAKMRKDDGSTVRNWGSPAPVSKPSVAAGTGSLTGAYTAVYTYVRRTDGKVAYETTPSPTSDSVTLASQGLDVAVIAAADPQINKIRVYRTVNAGSEHLFEIEVPNLSQTVTLVKTDDQLGAAVTTDAGPPPSCFGAATHQGHVFLVGDTDNPHYLWYSSRFLPENFPAGNFIELGDPTDPLKMVATFSGQLGVLSLKTKYRIIGNTASGFVPVEAPSQRGTPTPMAVLGTERGIVFVARDGLYLTTLVQPDQELSGEIQGLFLGETVNGYDPINWDASNTLSVGFFNDRVYLGYPSGSNTSPDMLAVFSLDTGKWYFYEMAVRSLHREEDTNTLTAGLTDGITYNLETGSSDDGSDISYEVETIDRAGVDAGSHEQRKIFYYVRPDLDTKGEDVTVAVVIDGTTVSSQTVNGTRTKPVLKLPETASGYAWRVKVTYTGTKRIKFYGAQMFYLPYAVA